MRILFSLRLFSLISVLLLMCAAAPAQEATSDEAARLLLPDQLGGFRAQGAPPSSLRDAAELLGPAASEDFDVVAAERRTYLGPGGVTLGVMLIKTRTASAAYAVLRHRAGLPDFSASSPLAGLGMAGLRTPRRAVLSKGITFVEVEGLAGPASDAPAEFARLLAESLEGQAGEIPVLVQHLPEWEQAQGRSAYAVSLPALQRAVPQGPVLDAVSFEGGAEAVVAPYGDARLVIVEFTTPQYAGDNDARITERIEQLRRSAQPTPTAYSRIGNYAVFVFDAPDEQAAKELMSGVKYEKEVRWLGDNPYAFERAQRRYSATMGSMILTTIKATGLSILLCLSVGSIFGYVVFVLRRRAKGTGEAEIFSDAGGMMRLNLLDDIKDPKASSTPRQLLAKGDH